MDRSEFLQRLREALGNDLSSSVVQENVEYYTSYINEEVAKGRSEAEVLQMLGDPWMLARTIVDTQGSKEQQSTVYESSASRQSESGSGQSSQGRVHIFGLDSLWKKLLVVLVVILIVVAIFSLVTGVISLLAPILVPVIIIMVVVRIIKGNRR